MTENATPPAGSTGPADKAASNRSSNKKMLKGCLLVGAGLTALLIIAAIIFAPSSEERAAMKRHDDSVSAAALSADSLAAEKKKSEWAALPKKTRDSILKQQRSDSLAAIKAVEDKEKIENPLRYLSIKSWNWQKSGFGAVGMVNVTFKNEGVKTAKDIVIKVSFNGESGTTLNTAQKVVPTVVAPGKSKTVSDINLGFIDGQTSNASIDIIDATFE